MEKKVKDIMVPIERCPTVSARSSVKDAIAVLSKALEAGPCTNNLTLLVMENNVLVGTAGLKDILQAVEPTNFKGGTYRGWTVPADWSPPLFLRGMFTEKCKELANRRVGDVMSPVSRLVNAEDTLLKAVHTLASGGFDSVPVWQGDRVVGMVGNVEMIDEMATLQLNTNTGAGFRKKHAAG